MKKSILSFCLLCCLFGCTKSISLEGVYKDYSGKVELVFTSEDKATLLINKQDVILLERKKPPLNE